MKNLLVLTCLLTLPAWATEPALAPTASPSIQMSTINCSQSMGVFTSIDQNCIDRTYADQIVQLKYDRGCIKREEHTDSKECALYVEYLVNRSINPLDAEFNQAEYEAYVGGYKASELYHGRRSNPTSDKEIYKKWIMYKFIKNLNLK